MAASESPECISGREAAGGLWSRPAVTSTVFPVVFGRTDNFGAPGTRISPIGVASGFSYLNPANSGFSGETQRGPSEMPRFKNFSSSVALALGLVLGFACSLSFGGELNARGKKEMQKIEAVVQENFTASNAKSVAGVVGTMTPNFPNQEQFKDELKQFFDEVDCYMRVVRVDFVEADASSQVVVVNVVQETLAGKDGEELPYSEFRERSAMLPPWELCEFRLIMHKIRGKWRIHEMGSRPQEVTREQLAARTGAQD
jgi:hypothetical protein